IAWVSTVCGLIGMAVGINYATNGTVYVLGAAGAVAIVGFIINFIGAIVTSVLIKSDLTK
ncbi:unnamed protein product, partial [Rotaria sp. Silwood1]